MRKDVVVMTSNRTRTFGFWGGFSILVFGAVANSLLIGGLGVAVMCWSALWLGGSKSTKSRP